jgi:hypothetical protein
VKSWFLATFGHDHHLNRWPQKMVEDYREETAKALGKAYPIKKIRERVIEAYPILARWGEPLDGRKLGWADLMYREATAIQAAMFRLKDHGIASFTVHDSLIVPRSAVSLAVDCLAEEYHRVAGTEHIALIGHSADEPDQLFIPHGAPTEPWLIEPEPEADSEYSFDEPGSEAVHAAAEREDEDDPFSPKDDDDFDPSRYGEEDDEDENAGTARWSDPEAAYRAPCIEWLKRDMLPPGRSHHGEDEDDEDRS